MLDVPPAYSLYVIIVAALAESFFTYRTLWRHYSVNRYMREPLRHAKPTVAERRRVLRDDDQAPYGSGISLHR